MSTDAPTADELADVAAIDYLLIEFEGRKVHGELLPYLLDLVDQRVIRLMDVVFVVKNESGEVESVRTDDLDDDTAGELAGASSGVLGHDDALVAAEALEPGTTGVLLLYENLWAQPFAAAARKAGGAVVARGHVETHEVAAVLDELDS